MRGVKTLAIVLFVFGSLAGALLGQPKPNEGVQQASSSYVIQPLDFVIFRIIGEPETEVQKRVASDGSVELPYVKSVKIGNMTVSDAQRFVYELYNGDYYIDPQIDFSVMASREKMVQVIGYVVRPGNISIPAEKPLYLMEAISSAGGAVPLGDLKRVEIRRTGANGDQEKITVNTQGITARDYELEDGDIIEVPRRII